MKRLTKRKWHSITVYWATQRFVLNRHVRVKFRIFCSTWVCQINSNHHSHNSSHRYIDQNSPPFDTPKSNLEQLSGVTHNSTKLRNKNHCSHFSSHKILNNNHNNHNSHHQDNKHLLLHYLHNGVHLVKTHRIVPRVSVALLETSTTKTSYPHNSRTAMKSLSVNHQGFRLSVGFIRSRRLPTNL